MALFFTLLYILTAYLSPEVVFGPLAEYHVEIYLAGITLICTLLSAAGSKIMSIPQTYAMFGLIVGVVLSVLFGVQLSETPEALMAFLPQCIAFFFVVINCRKKSHLQMVIAVLLFCALLIIYQGHHALTHDSGGEEPYLFRMRNDEHDDFSRIRGLSFLGDPNDLAQFLVGLIPCVFFFWNRQRKLLSSVFVVPLVAVLLYGMYLTHSRGAMVALLMVTIVAGRKKIGLLPSLIGGTLLFAALSAIGWSGGREISSESGSDRTDAWSTGLELLRAHPLFGVGMGRFAEHYPITAHNTIVVCAAELGLFGFFFWVMLVMTTVRDAVVSSQDPDAARRKLERQEEKLAGNYLASSLLSPASPERPAMPERPGPLTAPLAASVASGSGGAGFPATLSPLGFEPASSAPAAMPGSFFPPEQEEPLPDEEVRRLSGLMLVCLAGFLTAGWFLSRAYIMPLFVYLAIATVLFRMAGSLQEPPKQLAPAAVVKWAAITSAGLIVMMYILLRVNNLLGRG